MVIINNHNFWVSAGAALSSGLAGCGGTSIAFASTSFGTTTLAGCFGASGGTATIAGADNAAVDINLSNWQSVSLSSPNSFFLLIK